MAMNLEAVLRIAAKVVGLDEVTALERGLAGAEKAAGQAQGAFKAVVSSSAWQAAAAGAVAFSAAIGLSAKAAIDFESSMADVRKVVSGLETPKAFGEIKKEILDLSREMPVTADGFAQIYAAAGQSGIARGELKEFATLVAQVGVAFDMTAEQAGTSLAQMKVAFGLTTPGLRELADSLNYLSNSSGATASNLVEFMNRAGAVGKLAGLSGQQTAAFGAAMIQTGINTEVAATSFNNMIKALSKGPSMTERQIGALQRLGYSMANASQIEQELTRVAENESRRRLEAAKQQGNETVRVAEEQSRRRIEIARDETNQLSREINRRYRDQLQALQDNWDDQASAREEALQDAADAQIKALQKQQDREIKAAQERARALKIDADAEVDAIRDAYEQRIETVRDGTQRQLTLERRAARDQQQTVRDRLQDQQDAEIKGVNSRFEAVQEAEKARVEATREQQRQRVADVEEAEKAVLEKTKAAAKKTGEEMAAASAQGFADRLQGNAIGTITEVLGKIANLPKAQQLSVLSDLFGDEARGLAPMIANLGELERLLGVADDKAGNTGSVMEEFRVRSETAANKLQLFNNNLTALQIVVGEKVLPALVKLLEFMGPVISAISDFAQKNPGMTSAFVIIGGIISAIVLAAPAILAAMTVAGKIATAVSAMKVGATIAGWLGVVGPTVAKIIVGLGGIITWVTGTLVPFLAGVFSGPVGWTVLAVAAVVAMAYAFREPIMQFFAWLGGQIASGLQALWAWGEPIRAFWAGVWNQVVDFARTSLQAIGGVISWAAQAWYAILWQLFVQPWVNLWNLVLREPIMGALKWISDGMVALGKLITNELAGLIKIALQVFVKPWADLWNNVFREPVRVAVQWLGTAWRNVGDGFNRNVTEPIQKGWRALLEFLPNAMRSAVRFVQSVWLGMINTIRNAFRGFLVNIANGINSVGGAINKLIRTFNALPGPDIPLVGRIVVPAFAAGGFVNRATVGLVGEAGPEYIIPENKMAAASSRYLSGARGAAVLSTGTATVSSSGRGDVQITVKTGPVMEFNGDRYVKIEELDRAMRITAEGVIGRLRTPAARRALGVT